MPESLAHGCCDELKSIPANFRDIDSYDRISADKRDLMRYEEVRT